MITDEYFKKIFETIDNQEADSLNPGNFSPLVLAYIGDAVYEVFVRTVVISEGNAPVNKLHIKSIGYVKAKSQADTLRELNETLTIEEITDPQNFGSILRTAESVGVHGVIIPKRRSVSLDGVVAKASAGAVEYIPVARVSNLSNTIEHLKKKGIWIIGTEMDSGTVFYKTDLRGPVALVIGSEGAGIGRLIKENCDIMVNIPMKGVISSLNASVASAVVLYEIYKQRISVSYT